MGLKKYLILISAFILTFVVSCSTAAEDKTAISQVTDITPIRSTTPTPSATLIQSPILDAPVISRTPLPPSPTDLPTNTGTLTPTGTKIAFEIGKEITIKYLRDLDISGSDIILETELANGSNYRQYIASYISEGNKIFGLLTIPFEEPPAGGFKAIIFNHGYIPPAAYRTTERYTAYVDYLARSGFVVFKIDYRGHGESQGSPSGTYFSPDYTIDSIAALKSLQKLDIVDPQGIGMWGHSMAGNLVLRAMLIEPDIKAGVIWAGAVYSYDDFVKYGIEDNTYRPPATPETQEASERRSGSRAIFDTYGRPDTLTDYWKAVSLTANIDFLTSPLQLHHAEDDPVVNIGYSFDLATVLQEYGKYYEFYSYEGGGHNLISPYFDQAMQRTVEFFRNNL